MKKIFFVGFLFLSGCLSAPEKAFQIDPDSEVYEVSVAAVETIPMATHFDVLPHIENRMPTSPEEAVGEWMEKHLRPNHTTSDKLRVIVHQAEMLKADLPNESFFKPDEESYTLNYELDVQLLAGEKTLQSVPVAGKGFIQIAKKASLASKEKGWAWLIQKMLTHLKTKMQTDLENVFTR